MYLGAKMIEADKNDIVAKALAVNPKIKIFKANRDALSALTFTAL